MKNLNGDVISDEIRKELAERISNLSDKKIDELWLKCKFIYTDRTNEPYSALCQWHIDDIRKLKEESGILDEFLHETPLEDIFKNLEVLERE
jgi:hypothetical protein